MVKVNADSWFGLAHWEKLLSAEKKERHDNDVIGTEAEIKRMTEVNLIEVKGFKLEADSEYAKAVTKLDGLK